MARYVQVEATQFAVAPRTLVYGRVDTELRVAGSLERAFANVLHIIAIDLSEVGTSEQGAGFDGGGQRRSFTRSHT